MTPYVEFEYFLLLLYPVGALVVLGMLVQLRPFVVLVASVAIVLVQYGGLLVDPPVAGTPPPLTLLAAYAGTSIAVVTAYARLRPSYPGRPPFFVAIGLVLSPLVAAKVYPLAHGLLASRAPDAPVPAGLTDTIGFLGLSYMTLRAIDALIVVHDGVVKERPSPADVASYLLFAPTISAGPIDRFHRFTGDLAALPRTRTDYVGDVEAGIHRLAQGFLYKFILAYLIFRYALTPLATRTGVLAIVGYMYAFSLYLFFDFAGYSAFAIGVGRFFGIHVPENFRAPFVARNFRDMWDRWHITLSWWLRDHVYMRFVLHAGRRKWFGGDRWRAHVVGLLLTMGLMGVWHGLAPQYLVYGLYQGVMLVLYDVVGRWSERRGIVADGPWAHAASVVVTVNLFCVGLLIFSGRPFGTPFGAP